MCSKGPYQRKVRHDNLGRRPCLLILTCRKWQCRQCHRQHRQRFPGILKCQRASEAYREAIYSLHRDGINRSVLGRREGLGAATVERYFHHGLARQFAEQHPRQCPTVLGIDDHFFTRRQGFATTLCDLRNPKIYDVVLGRSEAALRSYLQRLEGQTSRQSGVHGSVLDGSFAGGEILSQRRHRGRPLPRHSPR
jgi:transposase